MLYIYLDESGDMGFNHDACSSYFVITALVCENRQTTKKIHYAVRRTLQKKVNHGKNCKRKAPELKGSATNTAIKKYFFNQLEDLLDWKLYTIVLDKRKHKASFGVPGNVDILYNMLTIQLLEQINFADYMMTSLIVDKRKNKKGMDDFNIHLRKDLGLLNITHEDSIKNYGLQAVDMFCYGIARKYERDDTEWYSVFQKFIYLEPEFQMKKKTAPAM